MHARLACLALALLAASAQAQEAFDKPVEITHRFASQEPGSLARIDVQSLSNTRGLFVTALKPGGEPAARLAYTDDIRINDTTYMDNKREDIVPGAKAPVALFQVMPDPARHDYSPALAGLCSGKGVPFAGLERMAGGSAWAAPDLNGPLRLYVIEETFEPGKVAFRFCKAIDLTPVR